VLRDCSGVVDLCDVDVAKRGENEPQLSVPIRSREVIQIKGQGIMSLITAVV